jgi:TolA-binding protein
MMNARVLSCTLVLVLAVPVFAQKKEIVEVQRDIGLLRDDLLQLKQSVDEKLANLATAVQATLDQVNATNRSVAVLEKAMRERMKEQEDTVLKPVSSLTGKVEGMTDEFRFVKESIADLNSRLGKLEQRLIDLDTAIKVRSAPPEPPPGGQTITQEAPPPGVSAAGLWDDAIRDKTSGRYDLAIQEFMQYLKYFGTTDMAPTAQYYIGDILYSQGKLQDAVNAFDSVLERYPDNSRTLDARLMKGRSFVKLGQRNEGANEFREIIKIAKGSEQAAKAASELRALGLSPGTAPSKAPSKKR